MAQVSQYAPDLWVHFGLTLLTVWDIDTLQFCGAMNYIEAQRALAARREAESRGR